MTSTYTPDLLDHLLAAYERTEPGPGKLNAARELTDIYRELLGRNPPVTFEVSMQGYGLRLQDGTIVLLSRTEPGTTIQSDYVSFLGSSGGRSNIPPAQAASYLGRQS